MAIKTRIQEIINNQINAEMYSAYLYQSMAAYCENIGLKGFANWMNIQAKEEMTHAMKFYAYLIERGGKVIFKEIAAPKTDWKDVIEIFEDVLKHEEHVTNLINNIVDAATEEKDHATVNVLQWFVAEQVEEEANAGEILQQLKIIEGKGPALFMIDKELKARVFIDQTVQN